MGRFSDYLICTDYDGSLAVEAKVSRENAEAIKYFQSEGGLFAIASGRAPSFLRERYRLYAPNAPVISMNGAIINDPETCAILREFTMRLDSARYLTELARYDGIHRIYVHGYGLNEGSEFSPDEITPEVLGDIPAPWYKVIFTAEASRAAELCELFRRDCGEYFDYDRSWPNGIEMHDKAGSKGACLRHLRDIIGRPGLKIIGVGDFENDLSLIRDADIGCAVGNAVQCLKDAADIITCDCREHAIARIICMLDSGELSGYERSGQ